MKAQRVGGKHLIQGLSVAFRQPLAAFAENARPDEECARLLWIGKRFSLLARRRAMFRDDRGGRGPWHLHPQ
jgi:hypothetical protein